jgi:redox-sensitive bicupin YhaK (pirin superfamily)
MMRPRYQEIPRERIPAAASSDGKVRVRVIAGEALGAEAVIDTRTPIMFLHYTLAPEARLIRSVPPYYTVFAYVFGGSGNFGSNQRGATAHQMVLFANDGEGISISSSAEGSGDLEVLVIGGMPLRETVARYGPFVMNTKQEISQAIEDYQSGKMGQIAAPA